MPESTVSLTTLMNQTSRKINVPTNELTMLDSKFIPVTEEGKGQQYLQHECKSSLFSFTDLEYWRAPSRRLYIVKLAEFEELISKKQHRLRLSLKKKRGGPSTDDEEEDHKIAKLEETVRSVSKLGLL